MSGLCIETKRRWVSVWIFAVVIMVNTPRDSFAHGGLGHIQVTAWAVENLPQGDLREFLAQPDIFDAILFGAAYPDIGYYPGLQSPELHRTYGEYSHWTPFISQFVSWIKANDPPPWTSLESRKRVAFLLGCATHGFQDEVFDSLFLPKVAYHDQEGQDAVDAGTDGLLVRDGHLGLIPSVRAPVDTLVELYNEAGLFDEEMRSDQLVDAVNTMGSLYVDEGAGPALAEFMISRYEDVLLWTAANYMEPSVAGSLHSEIFPTSRLIEAIWNELGGVASASLIVGEYPGNGWRLRSPFAANPGSWVTFLFSTGVDLTDLEVNWVHSSGEEVTFTLNGTAWGGDWPRVLRVMPAEDLIAGEFYSIELRGEVDVVSGGKASLERLLEFQVECEQLDDSRCANGEAPRVARIDGAETFREGWDSSGERISPHPEEEGCGGCEGAGSDIWWGLLLLVFLARWYRTRRPGESWFLSEG